MSASTLEAPTINTSFFDTKPAEAYIDGKPEAAEAEATSSFRSYLPLVIAFMVIISGISFMVGHHMALEMALNSEIESMMKVVEQHRSKS